MTKSCLKIFKFVPVSQYFRSIFQIHISFPKLATNSIEKTDSLPIEEIIHLRGERKEEFFYFFFVLARVIDAGAQKGQTICIMIIISKCVPFRYM